MDAVDNQDETTINDLSCQPKKFNENNLKLKSFKNEENNNLVNKAFEPSLSDVEAMGEKYSDVCSIKHTYNHINNIKNKNIKPYHKICRQSDNADSITKSSISTNKLNKSDVYTSFIQKKLLSHYLYICIIFIFFTTVTSSNLFIKSRKLNNGNITSDVHSITNNNNALGFYSHENYNNNSSNIKKRSLYIRRGSNMNNFHHKPNGNGRFETDQNAVRNEMNKEIDFNKPIINLKKFEEKNHEQKNEVKKNRRKVMRKNRNIRRKSLKSEKYSTTTMSITRGSSKRNVENKNVRKRRREMNVIRPKRKKQNHVVNDFEQNNQVYVSEPINNHEKHINKSFHRRRIQKGRRTTKKKWRKDNDETDFKKLTQKVEIDLRRGIVKGYSFHIK